MKLLDGTVVNPPPEKHDPHFWRGEWRKQCDRNTRLGWIWFWADAKAQRMDIECQVIWEKDEQFPYAGIAYFDYPDSDWLSCRYYRNLDEAFKGIDRMLHRYYHRIQRIEERKGKK